MARGNYKLRLISSGPWVRDGFSLSLKREMLLRMSFLAPLNQRHCRQGGREEVGSRGARRGRWEESRPLMDWHPLLTRCLSARKWELNMPHSVNPDNILKNGGRRGRWYYLPFTQAAETGRGRAPWEPLPMCGRAHEEAPGPCWQLSGSGSLLILSTILGGGGGILASPLEVQSLAQVRRLASDRLSSAHTRPSPGSRLVTRPCVQPGKARPLPWRTKLQRLKQTRKPVGGHRVKTVEHSLQTQCLGIVRGESSGHLNSGFLTPGRAADPRASRKAATRAASRLLRDGAPLLKAGVRRDCLNFEQLWSGVIGEGQKEETKLTGPVVFAAMTQCPCRALEPVCCTGGEKEGCLSQSRPAGSRPRPLDSKANILSGAVTWLPCLWPVGV